MSTYGDKSRFEGPVEFVNKVTHSGAETHSGATEFTGAVVVSGALTVGGLLTLNNTANFKVGSVASATELVLGDGTFFTVTGTNNITSIAAASSLQGRLVVLKFAEALNFTKGNNLKLASTMSTTANDTITLICDGTDWYEIARSVI